MSLRADRLLDVSGRTVLITGGSRGIGAMMAEAFAVNGATVRERTGGGAMGERGEEKKRITTASDTHTHTHTHTQTHKHTPTRPHKASTS